ncbi:hypothetical protein E4U36_001463 [Claviceps purpurea]|nr:hypothetical protein E4U36_001463 [Claviceps purpurea]
MPSLPPGTGVPRTRARESAPEFRPAREGTVDTVTTTGSTTKKSAKMPDPPIFEGSEGSIDLENWLIGITSALQANAVVFRRLGDFREMFHLFLVRVSLGHNKAEFSDPQIQIGLYARMVGHAQHCSLGTPGGVLSSMLVMASCIMYVESAVIVVLHDIYGSKRARHRTNPGVRRRQTEFTLIGYSPNVESGSSIRAVGYPGATRHLDLLGYEVRDGHAFLGGSS